MNAYVDFDPGVYKSVQLRKNTDKENVLKMKHWKTERGEERERETERTQ